MFCRISHLPQYVKFSFCLSVCLFEGTDGGDVGLYCTRLTDVYEDECPHVYERGSCKNVWVCLLFLHVSISYVLCKLMTQDSLVCTWSYNRYTHTCSLAPRGNASKRSSQKLSRFHILLCKWEHILFNRTLRSTSIYHVQTHTHLHLLLQIHLLKTLVLCTPATGLTQYKLVHYTVTLSHMFPAGWWPLDHYAASCRGWQVRQLMCECVYHALWGSSFWVFISFGQLRCTARSLFSTCT